MMKLPTTNTTRNIYALNKNSIIMIIKRILKKIQGKDIIKIVKKFFKNGEKSIGGPGDSYGRIPTNIPPKCRGWVRGDTGAQKQVLCC
jgi:hypothetical protein